MNPQEFELQKQVLEKQQLYQRVFNTDDGQRVLEDLANRCFEKHTTFDENPHRVYFNEGRRSIYKFISGQLNRDLTKIAEALTKTGEDPDYIDLD